MSIEVQKGANTISYDADNNSRIRNVPLGAYRFMGAKGTFFVEQVLDEHMRVIELDNFTDDKTDKVEWVSIDDALTRCVRVETYAMLKHVLLPMCRPKRPILTNTSFTTPEPSNPPRSPAATAGNSPRKRIRFANPKKKQQRSQLALLLLGSRRAKQSEVPTVFLGKQRKSTYVVDPKTEQLYYQKDMEVWSTPCSHKGSCAPSSTQQTTSSACLWCTSAPTRRR